MSAFYQAGRAFALVLQFLTTVSVAILAVGLTGYSVACALGRAPWLSLPLTFGDLTYAQAGTWIQIGLAALCAGLAAFLPSNRRIMALENSHRRFHIGMQDVTRAYQAAHAADRAGAFHLKSEFDSIRERMAFLRDHPDLAELEPSVIEIAAQMSHISRELAQTYSDANVMRARDFLIQRQADVEEFNARLDEARIRAAEIRQWHVRVDMDESVARAQLARLREELAEILPEITGPQPPAPHISAQHDAIGEGDGSDADGDDGIVRLLSRRRAAE